MILCESYMTDLDCVFDVPSVDRLRGASLLITGATGLIGSCIVDMMLKLNQFF